MLFKRKPYEIFKRKPYEIYVKTDDKSNIIASTLRNFASRYKEIQVVCIGTDRSTGDALGPLVGTFLEHRRFPYPLYGTLKNPVHAENLESILKGLKRTDICTIAIDSCLGRLDSIGVIKLKTGPLAPGSGVGKNLPKVGDISITAVVNVGGYMEYLVLQNTRLALVWNLAEFISDQVYKAFVQEEVEKLEAASSKL